MTTEPTPNEIVLTEPPNLVRELARGALTSGLRTGGGTLPNTRLRITARIDRENLFAYQKLCGFVPNDALPPTYPHLLGFPLQARLMAARAFPLPLAGLVHLRNEITQRDPLFAHDEPQVTVHAENLRPHAKGTAVDLITRVEVLGATAWESRSTYLRRGSGTEGATDAEEVPGVPESLPVAKWRLPADLGRSYAAISGDVNPIHLHPLTARAFGFPRTIAHGMWTYARTLAALGAQVYRPGESVVWFRKPVLLPGSVRLVREPVAGEATVAALLSAGKEPKTHLIARWSPR